MSFELESPLRLNATLRQVITNISLLSDAQRLLEYNIIKEKFNKNVEPQNKYNLRLYKKIRFNHPLDRRFNQS